MKTIHNFQDLQQYGVNVLTGEACRYGMRLLCDVNEDGQRLLVEFYDEDDIFHRELATDLWNQAWDSAVVKHLGGKRP